VDATHIADQVLTGSAALAGLLLIFLGNAVSGIDGYAAGERTAAIKRRYRRRGWGAFAAFALSLVAALLSLAFYWDGCALTVTISAILLAGGFLAALGAALVTALDIG
jgi:hypothetical protein